MSADKVVDKAVKWLTQTVRLGAIFFFFYCAYEGVFKAGGSTMVFVGVFALLFTLIICYFIDLLPDVYKR